MARGQYNEQWEDAGREMLTEGERAVRGDEANGRTPLIKGEQALRGENEKSKGEN